MRRILGNYQDVFLTLNKLCTGQFQNHPSPPGQTPGHLTFLKNSGKIPRYVESLDGQMHLA